MQKYIWYISKYASTPKARSIGPARQFGYSKEFVKKGHKVRLISSKSNGMPLESKFDDLYSADIIDGVEYVQIKGPEVNLGFSIKRIISWIIFEINLRKYLNQQKEFPDTVIVSSLSLLTIINGIWLKKKHGVKFVLEVRDIWPLTLIEMANLSKWNPFVIVLSFIEKKGYNQADAIVGTMPNLKEHVESIIGKTNKVFCIPMAYDPDFFNNQQILSDNVLSQIPKDKFIVGYAGAFGIANAVHELIRVSKKMINNKNIHFVLLGDGPEKNKLIESTIGQNNITYFDKVDKNKVNSFLSKCNVLVITIPHRSIYKFGVSPNKWIDYMYASKPIIVAYDGYRSIINEANCGEFVKASDTEALEKVIQQFSEKSINELEEIGLNGKEYLVKELNLSTLADKYIELL